MQKLSVVIACKNAANVIGETLKSFAGLTDDILVYDNGSTDGTQEIVKNHGANWLKAVGKASAKQKIKQMLWQHMIGY